MLDQISAEWILILAIVDGPILGLLYMFWKKFR